MADREKVMNALGRCESYGYCNDKQCPYYENTGCLESLRKDVMELMKEKEPQIISLEELICLSRNTLIYMELRNDIHGWEIYDGFDGRTRDIITGSLWGPHEFWDSSEYGRTWRCWSFPPTNEQRKKEVW